MEKCAALSNLLQNKPDKLSFSVLSCGNVKVAGMDDLFTLDEVRMMLKTRFNWREGSVNEFVEELERTKEASAPVDAAMIPTMEKTADTAVIVDMYEVDYSPITEGASTQAIEKHFDAVNDFVSRMTFPDTTVSDIIVGPKEQIFKKKVLNPIRRDLPQDKNVPTRAQASIWVQADGLPHEGNYAVIQPSSLGGVGLFAHSNIPKGTLVYSSDYQSATEHPHEISISSEQIKSLPPEIQKLYDTYGVVLPSGEVSVPKSFNRMSIIWYINHAKGTNANIVADSYYNYYAKRDIAKGEELLVDYDTIDASQQNDFVSKPSSPNAISTDIQPNERIGSSKDKCPECGSTEYGWMPTDFETAKCSKCGKTWQGKNPPLPPKSADDSFVSLLDEGLKDEVQGAAYWSKVADQLRQKGDEENAKKASEHTEQENNHHAFLEELHSKYATTKESSWHKLALLGGRAIKPCASFESAQEPEESTSVCYHCGWLRRHHGLTDINDLNAALKENIPNFRYTTKPEVR